MIGEAVLGGFVLDTLFGDPPWLPHPVVLMGKAISALEKRLRARLPQTPQGELLGGEDDARMLSILYNQRLNGKIPFFLHGVKIAHKTGEDDGTTHDAALIQAKRPFVLCMLSNDVDVPEYERLMQDTARELYEMYNR